MNPLPARWAHSANAALYALQTALAMILMMSVPVLGLGLFAHSTTGCQRPDPNPTEPPPPVFGDQGRDQAQEDQAHAHGPDCGHDLGATTDHGHDHDHGGDQGTSCGCGAMIEEVARLQDELKNACDLPANSHSNLEDGVLAPPPGGAKKNVPIPVVLCQGEVTARIDKLNIQRRHVSITVFQKDGQALSARPMPLDEAMEADRSLYLRSIPAVLSVTGCTATGCTLACTVMKPLARPAACPPPALKP